jgi:LacI family transcriptional regulator
VARRRPVPPLELGHDGSVAVRRPPTILDVASRAGVSKSTVSNVVRGLPGVSEETRRRVHSAIKHLGYRPNVLARQLVQQRTSLLGVVVGDLANPFFAEMAKSVERHAAARGYTAIFCNTGGESQSELAGVETLLEHRVAGIVFLAFSGESRIMRETLQHQVPVVFVSCHEDWGDVVSVDDVKGGRLATRHLIDAGHRRIAYLSIPELEDRSDHSRYQGYRDEMAAARIGELVRISWSPPSDHAVVDGVDRTLREVFAGPDPITAVFASNDVAGIDLQEFADRYGLRVPEDLSVVGFDDVPMAGLARIGLTTVSQPRDELAKLGITTIIERIERKLKGPPRMSLIGVSLVERASTSRLTPAAPGRREPGPHSPLTEQP